jgi:hypothetical protein
VALGFPTDPKGMWLNVYGGSEAMFEDLLRARHDLTSEIQQFGYILEHWLPKTSDPNSIMVRSLALSEASQRSGLL